MSGLRSSSELSVIVYGGVMRPASSDCCCCCDMVMLTPTEDGGCSGSNGAITDEGLICGGGSPTGQPSCDATEHGRIVAALNMSCCCCSSQRVVGSILEEEDAANTGPAPPPQPEFKSQSTLPISGRVRDCDLVWLLLLPVLFVPLLRVLEIIDAPPPQLVVPFWLVDDVESARFLPPPPPPLPVTPSTAPPGDDARPSR